MAVASRKTGKYITIEKGALIIKYQAYAADGNLVDYDWLFIIEDYALYSTNVNLGEPGMADYLIECFNKHKRGEKGNVGSADRLNKRNLWIKDITTYTSFEKLAEDIVKRHVERRLMEFGGNSGCCAIDNKYEVGVFPSDSDSKRICNIIFRPTSSNSNI